MENRASAAVIVPGHDVLFERAGDLATIDAWLAAAGHGDGSLVVVEGPAGIGKTALLERGLQHARARGILVVRARASELERDFAYGVVRQMLEPVVALLTAQARAGLFEGAARPAALVLGAEETAQAGASFGVLHGLYWVVVGLASEAPLVLCVDDVQWADWPSLRFLVYLARRLESTSVRLLLGLRTSEAASGDDLQHELRSTAGACIVRPSPLSAGAVVDVVRCELGERADRDFCLACHRASGGNPFYLRELLRSLVAGTVEPSREQVQRVAEVWPASIARHVLTRIARLGAGAADLAGAMAVLGDGGRLRHAAALAGVREAGAIARALREMEILAEDEPFRFSHPIVRGAVYGDLPHDRRERLHLRAACLIANEGGDGDRVSAHLLAVAPARRAWCAQALRSSARQAIARGAPETAVVHLRRALAETPTAADGRVAVLCELGLAEEQSADPAAVPHLQQAHGLCDEPRVRALIALDLARTLETRGLEVEAVDVLRSASVECQGLDDPGVKLRLQVAVLGAAAVDARAAAPDDLEVFGRLLGDPPDGAAGLIVQALAAAAAVWVGAPAPVAVPLAEAACARGLLETEQWNAIGACIWSLILCERYAAAKEHLAALRDTVERSGHARGLALVLQLQANRAERLGDLAEAEASARVALEIVEQSEHGVGGRSWILCSLVDVLVERGSLAEAEAALSLMPAGEWPPHVGCISTLAARGRLRLAQDRPEEALADLLRVGRHYREWPGVALNGPAPSHWRSSTALVLQRLGDLEQARRVAADELAAARTFDTPRATGIALRVAGLVAPAEETLPQLQASVDVLRESPATLQRARSSIALGAALRRRGQRVAARGPLREGLDGARRCGATPLTEFAAHELIAAGARPRREALTGLAALTASERRVADLAADGLTNRQLAQALFLSPKTIEMHIGRVYRKLEIASRGELAAALSA